MPAGQRYRKCGPRLGGAQRIPVPGNRDYLRRNQRRFRGRRHAVNRRQNWRGGLLRGNGRDTTKPTDRGGPATQRPCNLSSLPDSSLRVRERALRWRSDIDTSVIAVTLRGNYFRDPFEYNFSG